MTTWQQFTEHAPDLAAAVRARFEAATHHVIATLRADGSPRVSGTEVQFHGPDLVLGSMPDAVKARDLQRDGRCALHASTNDASMEGGDAKITAHAVEVTDPDELGAYRAEFGPPPGEFHLFRLDLDEAVHITLGDDGQHLLIRLWRPGQDVTEFHRR